MSDPFLPNILKVKNDPQALGRILIDLILFGQTGRFFFIPKGPPCRANFLSICPRIKFLFTKLLEIENYGKKLLRIHLASGAHFPTFYVIQNGSSFYNIHPRIKCLT